MIDRLLFFFLLLPLISFSQSKKKQIELLNYSLDSLQILYNNQNDLINLKDSIYSKNNDSLNKEINQKEDLISTKNQYINDLIQQINKVKIELNIKEQLIIRKANKIDLLTQESIVLKDSIRMYNDSIEKLNLIANAISKNDSLLIQDIMRELYSYLYHNTKPKSNAKLSLIDKSELSPFIKALVEPCWDCAWVQDDTLMYFAHCSPINHLFFIYDNVKYLIPLKSRPFYEYTNDAGGSEDNGELMFEGQGFTIINSWNKGGSHGPGSFGEVKLYYNSILKETIDVFNGHL